MYSLNCMNNTFTHLTNSMFFICNVTDGFERDIIYSYVVISMNGD